MDFVVVGHHFWGSPGGGQLVCASVAKSFERLGFGPVLSGVFRFDSRRYVEWYGIDLTKYPTVTLPLGLRAFGLWGRLFVWLPLRHAIDRYKPFLVFLDEVTYRPILSRKARYGFKLIEYIHFPFEVVYQPRFRGSGLHYGEDPYIMERYGKFPMNIYWRVFTWGLSRVARDNPFHAADFVLVNSRWTANVAKIVYGEEPTVLNPPLPPNIDVVKEPRSFDVREPVIVMVGRFSEEKRYHWVVTELMPKLIKEVPGTRLVIFGGANTPTQRAYLGRVRALAEGSGLRVAVGLGSDADVFLVPNAPRRVINEVMDNARVFLHATINEHWGIVVAEAMARALPPVVHRSGGAWTDLVEEGRYGLGYESVDEAVNALAKLLTDGRAWQSLASAIPGRVLELTLDKFTEKLGKYIR